MGVLSASYANTYSYFIPRILEDPSTSYGKFWYEMMAEEMGFKFVPSNGCQLPFPSNPPPSFNSNNSVTSGSTLFLCPSGHPGRYGWFYESISYGIMGLLLPSNANPDYYSGVRPTQISNPSSKAYLWDSGNTNFYMPGAGMDPKIFSYLDIFF